MLTRGSLTADLETLNMRISTTRPLNLTRPSVSSGNQVAAAPSVSSEHLGPTDTLSFSGYQSQGRSAGRAFLGAAVGTGIGVLAGLNSGLAAGLGGAAVMALPGALVGGISGAMVAERAGQSESSGVVGAGLWGAILGGVVGATGGALLGSHVTGLSAVVGLGAAGCMTGFLSAGS